MSFVISAFQFYEAPASPRWTRTATNGSGLQQGDPTTLTWSFIADGISIPGAFTGEVTSDSNFIAFLNGIYGSQANWFPVFESIFDRWSELGGINYVYEPNDDGAEFGTYASAGILGTRGDIRIGGHTIDGDGNPSTLGYNFSPDFGELVIDTADSFFNNTDNNSIRLRNTLAHETGHGLGFEHVASNNSKALLESRIDVSFDGPQLDDILALHRQYGDAYESPNGLATESNDSTDSAYDLGLVTPATSLAIGTDASDDTTIIESSQKDFISIDDDSDQDFFRFSIESPTTISIILDPRGATYNESALGGTQTSLNTKALSDLSLAILDSNGNELAQAHNFGSGFSESINNLVLTSIDDYYIRVSGANDNVQLYELGVSIVKADKLIGSQGDDTLLGYKGDDRLFGRNGNDNLLGGDDNDIIRGEAGNDTIDGGNGTDRLQETADVNFTATEGTLTGLGTDSFSNIEVVQLFGGGSDNTIDASALTNTRAYLYGRDGDDSLIGGAANDILQGEAGNDTIDGGNGTDHLREIADVNFTATEGTLTGLGTDSFSNIEVVQLFGGGSDNTIDASALTNTRAYLYGRDGDDSLIGGAANDILRGEAGNDTIDGGNGTDRLREIADVNFTATEGTLTGLGTDSFSNIEVVQLFGGGSDNTIDASALTNTQAYLYGRDGDDSLIGGAANDILRGEAGNDTIDGGNGTDRLREIADVNFTATEGTLTGLGTDSFSNIEVVQLFGGGSDNTIDASALTNTRAYLYGRDGDDSLTGGAANDILRGDEGEDLLIGRKGNDRLYLGESDGVTDTVSYSLGEGIDSVFDFTRGLGGDLINFSGITDIDVIIVGNNTEFRQTNASFGTGNLLVTVKDVATFQQSDVNTHLTGANFNFSPLL